MIALEEKYIHEYILDTFNSIRLKNKNVKEYYHHNSEYKDAPSICSHGILSLKELNKKGITNYSETVLKTMDDIESHVNGNDSISLSRVGLDDLYENELEYNPYSPNLVDFIVSDKVKARRSSIHYGNEYLIHERIELDKLMAIDIRLLKLLEQRKTNISEDFIKKVIEKFNYLKDIAIAMKQSKLDIPLREKSTKENFVLDIDKLSTIEQIKIK